MRSHPHKPASAKASSTWLCVGLFLCCVLLIWPVLESGLTDDWSTVRTAQLLAETGHIHYNGWEAAILGWPLYVAALFMRLFGPSFLSARASDLVEAVLVVILMHRTFLRAGLTSFNASMGVLAVASTPMFLLASVVFMTDIPGVLAILFCFYCCLRALEADTPRNAAAWIAAAALSNAILGTSRQIAWLGVLLMVPCTAWLLRSIRPVVITAIVCCSVSYAFLAACMHWFDHQPYILLAPLLPRPLRLISPVKVMAVALRSALDLILFSLPILFAFVPSLRRATRRTGITLAVVTAIGIAFAVTLRHLNTLGNWLAPFLIFPYVHPQTVENTFTMTSLPMKGPAPATLARGPRDAVTWMIFAGVVALIAALTARPRPASAVPITSVSMRQLVWLLAPVCAVYLAFLLSRGTYNFVYDRYLLPILPLLLLLLLRWYQAREGPRIPVACGLLVAAMAAYSILTLHDVFASYRAALAACNQVLAAGYPRTAIDGGWEYNHFTQILAGTYVHQPGVRLPDGTILPNLDTNSGTDCSMDVREWTPDLHPLFTLGYPGTPCKPAPDFAPVSFHTWLPPHARAVQIFRYSLEGPAKPQPVEQ